MDDTTLTAATALQLPVRLHGLQLARPVDFLLATEPWHALGFVVHCRDESQRFLPYAACQPKVDEIAVGSALMLLEDVEFYRSRGASFRDLLGAAVESGGRRAGTLRDLVLGRGGEVEELLVERARVPARLPAAGCRIVSPRASAA
jgi:hypothetical protein